MTRNGVTRVLSLLVNTAVTNHPYDTYNSRGVRLTQALRDAAQG
ncbi:MAG TPA: hypothetical protein VE669_02810 [Actinomycetota bacterium]|nr:hypothetical protein [Actinomycetota bacterium]